MPRVVFRVHADPMASLERTASPEAHRSLHHQVIRKLLGAQLYLGTEARREATQIAPAASQVVDTQTDVINIFIEGLIERGYELPSFSTLVTFAEQVHEAVQQELHIRIAQRLSAKQREWQEQGKR